MKNFHLNTNPNSQSNTPAREHWKIIFKEKITKEIHHSIVWNLVQ